MACPLKEIPIENKDWLLNLKALGTHLPQTNRAPVSELFSVGVCRDSKYFQQRDMLEIYGTITLYDQHYNTYQLYHRSRDDPQTLTPQHNLLSLDMSVDCLVSTSWSLIFLCLMDKADDSVIVREGLSFVKLTDINQYNQVRQIDYKSVFVTYFAVDVTIMVPGSYIPQTKEIPIKKNEEWLDHVKKEPYLPHIIGAPASELFSVAGDDVRTPKEIPVKNEKWFDHLKKQPYLRHVLAAPSSELFYVAVEHKYFGNRDKIEIYGTITISDEDGTPYQVYCRDSDYPETLTPQHNLLSLDMPAECLVSTSWSHISLNLKDKAGDGVIVEKDLYFDKLTDINQYNKVRQLAYSPVLVTYVAFPAAVVAILKITLIKKNDSAAPVPLNLSGKIIARCGNTYGHKYPGILLLNHVSNQPIEANDPIELGRDVVVVPGYSFLRIDFQLSQHDPHQQDINCCVDFFATHLFKEDRYIEAQNFVVHFNVRWFHPYQLKPETRQPFRENFSCNPWYYLMEVYTVMIHHDTNSELEITGRIGIRDGLASLLLFDRKGLNPLKISGNEETLSIDVKSRCFLMSDYLSMGLKFKDVEGRVFIRGQISWSEYCVENPMSWYDKRACSIIRGVHGYATVFYTIFSNAVQAKVKISFECNGYPDARHCLDGSVVARHSNGTYLTEHDKAYYQSVLFRGKSSDLESGCTLPLSKSLVAVPSGAVLMVAVNLHARLLSPEHQLEQDLKLDVCFNSGSVKQQIIERGNYSIKVSVRWSDVDRLMSQKYRRPTPGAITGEGTEPELSNTE
ncbi:uncharacterized protein LOC141642553 [Silene latifolia]|uniref:uncharacterized protein LOC141642553 n=1 Tax=Silene latifolia TaxID=37657 RepID=UPI003D779E78